MLEGFRFKLHRLTYSKYTADLLLIIRILFTDTQKFTFLLYFSVHIKWAGTSLRVLFSRRKASTFQLPSPTLDSTRSVHAFSRLFCVWTAGLLCVSELSISKTLIKTTAANFGDTTNLQALNFLILIFPVNLTKKQPRPLVGKVLGLCPAGRFMHFSTTHYEFDHH